MRHLKRLAESAALLLIAIVSPIIAQEQPPVVRARFLRVEGIQWRDDQNRGLDQVEGRGGKSIWTVSPDALGRLLGRAHSVRQVDLGEDAAPEQSINFVGRMERYGDGPVDEATTIAFRPHVDQVQDGLELRVIGQIRDDGVMVDVDAHASEVVAFHLHRYTEGVPAMSPSWSLSTSYPFLIWNDQARLTASYSIPEVVESSLAGQWTIPKGQALILALGVHREQGANGKSALIERLIVLDAGDFPEPEITPMGLVSVRRGPAVGPFLLGFLMVLALAILSAMVARSLRRRFDVVPA